MSDTTIKVTADTAQALQALSQLTQSLNSLVSSVNSNTQAMGNLKTGLDANKSAFENSTRGANTFGDALGSVKTVLTAVGLSLGVKEIIALGDAYITTSNQIATVTNSQAQATQAFKDVSSTSMATGQRLEAVTDLFQKAALATKQMGMEMADATQFTDTWSKSLSAFHVQGAAADSVLYNLSQAISKNRQEWQDWRIIAMNAPQIFEGIAKSFGMSVDEFRQKIEQYKVGREDIFNATKKLKDDVDPLFETLHRTVSQSMEGLRTQLIITAGEIETKYHIFSNLAEGIKLVGENIDKIIPIIAAFAGAWAAAEILTIVQNVMKLTVAIQEMGVAAAAAEALATGGLSAIAAIVGAGAAWIAANQMFSHSEGADKAKKELDDLKEKSDLWKEASKEPLTLQGPTIDEKALLGATEQYLQQNNLMLQFVNYSKLRLEQEKAVLGFAREQHYTYQDIAKTQAAGTIRNSIQQLMLAEEETKITKELEQATQGVDTARSMMLTRSLQDMAANDRIMQITREIGVELSSQDMKMIIQTERLKQQATWLKSMSTSYAEINRAKTGAEAGAEFMKALPNMSQSAASNQQFTQTTSLLNGADNAYAQGLINEQQYEEAKFNIKSQYAQKILEMEQKFATDGMKNQGVTNQAIIDSVKAQMENVAMIQRGGIVGAQGVLGAMDNVFASMSTHNKKAFEAHKALATAQALISTYQAAAMAIAAPPGPPWSFIYVAGAIAAGMAQVATIQSQSYSGKALGGSVSGNTPYIVGEKGPEMFVPAGSGTIVPNSEISGGKNVNINFTIQATDATGFDTLLTQRRGMITQFVRDALAEQGQRSAM